MSDTFKSPQWQAFMKAELAFSRRPGQATADAVRGAFHRWAARHLTQAQRRDLAEGLENRLTLKLRSLARAAA